jgi:hypothetical protein
LNGYDCDAEYVFGRVATIIGSGGAWRNVTAELIPDCGVRGSAATEDLSLEAAAQFLGVSRTFARSLIDDGKLPSRIDKTDHRRFGRIPTSALRAYREKMRAEQRAGLQKMVEASERAGLYDAEIEELPKRQRNEDENE